MVTPAQLVPASVRPRTVAATVVPPGRAAIAVPKNVGLQAPQTGAPRTVAPQRVAPPGRPGAPVVVSARQIPGAAGRVAPPGKPVTIAPKAGLRVVKPPAWW